MCPGLFGDLFDMNNDGKLDYIEEGMELSFLAMMEKERLDGKLRSSGVDPNEFQNMSSEERSQALADAGLGEGEFTDYDILP